MSKKNRLSMEELKTEAKLFAGNVLVEAIVLAPRRTVHIAGKDFTVQGLFPLAQKQIAGLSQTVMNNVLPKAAETASDLLSRTGAEPFLRDKFLDFTYGFLNRFSLNTLLTKLFERSSLLERNQFSNALRDYLNGILNNKDDRDTLIRNITESTIHAMRVLTDGTIFSVLLSDKVAESITEALSAVLDRLLNTDFGNAFAGRLLNTVEQMDELTIPHILEKYFGYDRVQMSQAIDRLYDKYLGKGMVQNLKTSQVGNKLYSDLANLDYDRFFRDLRDNHLDDLVRIAVGGASAGLYLMNASKSMSERREKARAFRARIREVGDSRKNKKAARKAAKNVAKAAKDETARQAAERRRNQDDD